MILKFVFFGLIALIKIRFSTSSTCDANCLLDYNSCSVCGPTPININLSDVIKVDLPPLQSQNAPNEYGTLINNGVSLEIIVRQPTKFSLSGGPFACTNDNYTYYKDRLYFTNSSTQVARGAFSGEGSNIAIDGVFFNSKYGSYENALGHTDGICVFGYLVNSRGTKNVSNFDDFANAIRQVITPQSSVTLQEGSYYSWVASEPIMENSSYLFYQGEYSERASGDANTCSYCATIIMAAPGTQLYNISITQAQYDDSFGLLRNAINTPLEYIDPIYDADNRPVYQAEGLNYYNVD